MAPTDRPNLTNSQVSDTRPDPRLSREDRLHEAAIALSQGDGVPFTARDYHGLTARSNFTWGRALGTGSVTQSSSSITVPNPYDFNTFGTYGLQPFDVKVTYSLLMLYQPPSHALFRD